MSIFSKYCWPHPCLYDRTDKKIFFYYCYFSSSVFKIISWIFFSVLCSPSGKLLLPSENPVALVLRCPGGSLYPALHQSLWKQPPGAVLCGVSRTLAPGWACPFCPAWNIWRPLGGAVYQGQHCLVQETWVMKLNWKSETITLLNAWLKVCLLER